MMPSAPPQPPHAPGNGRRIAFALAAMAMMSAGLYGLIEADVIDLAALLTMILLAASAMAWAAMTFARPAQHMGKPRSEEHTSELQSLMRNSYAVFCLKKKNKYDCYHRT